MNNLNSAIVQGNLTRDPDLRYLPTGVAVAELSIAVNRSYKDKKSGELKEEVSYLDIVAFAKTAEVCAEHLKKGRSILVDGQLRQERWENEKGEKRSKVKIVARSVHFLGPKPGPGEGAGKSEPQPAAAAAPEPSSASSSEDQEPPF